MARHGTIAGILRLLLVGAVPLVSIAGPAPAAFTQEIYVWQRSAGPAVQTALQNISGRRGRPKA